MSDRSYQPTVVGLRAFVAIARKRHFGSAAGELGVSQPSLSQALSMLEEGLGVRLVERNTRKVLLTPEGDALLEKAISALMPLTNSLLRQAAFAIRLPRRCGWD